MADKSEYIDKVMEQLDKMIAAKTQKAVNRLRTEISDEIIKAGEQFKKLETENQGSINSEGVKDMRQGDPGSEK